MIAEGVSSSMNTALMVMIGRGGDGNVVKEGLTGRMKHDQERMRWEDGGWTIGVSPGL